MQLSPFNANLILHYSYITFYRGNWLIVKLTATMFKAPGPQSPSQSITYHSPFGCRCERASPAPTILILTASTLIASASDLIVDSAFRQPRSTEYQFFGFTGQASRQAPQSSPIAQFSGQQQPSNRHLYYSRPPLWKPKDQTSTNERVRGNWRSKFIPLQEEMAQAARQVRRRTLDVSRRSKRSWLVGKS
ncbi:hypothetical protein VTK56DRAFT_9537 [Thermocarpiscus australiensis]